MPRTDPSLPVAVIGGGVAGTLTALNLRQEMPGRSTLLFERGPAFARGAAYSTTDPAHVLNVRAENMSACPDGPSGFVDWLRVEGHAVPETAAGRFAPRELYGCYVAALLGEAVELSKTGPRIELRTDEVLGLESTSAGFAIATRRGARTEVAGAVIAVGNLPAPATGDDPPELFRNPWAPGATQGLAETGAVVVVGMGLTAVDVIESLRGSGFRGPILAMSRRGLLPRSHVAPKPWQKLDPTRISGGELSRRLAAFRDAVAEAGAADTPWQSVMDALRPATRGLWLGLTDAQRSRFVRHLKPWWDTHRHRLPPPNADRLRRRIEDGGLEVAAGRILGVVRAEGPGVDVRWMPRGGSEQTTRAQRLIYATGPASLEAAGDALIEALLAAGLARPDHLGVGLEVTEQLQIVGRDGSPTPGLWALGPIVRGSLWECTAVPDIRTDARALATRIAATLAT